MTAINNKAAALQRLLSASLVVGFLAGCATPEPKPEQKPVAVAAPSAPPAASSKAKPEAPVTEPAERAPVKVDPFSDPSNPLSKRSIYFEFDKSIVMEEYSPIVHAHAAYLATHPGARIRVEGNCDERGSREYNLALGQRRGDSVGAMMKLLGASAGQIETVSYGEEKPLCTRHDEDCWSQNRRSDIKYVTKE